MTDRAPNRQGQGGRLRTDLVRAARTLLERSGTEDAVTLRATAREAGVTAPAIYAHFTGVEDLVRAVIDEAFQEFDAAVRAAMHDAPQDPASRLEAGCWAYIQYAHRHPATYHVLFSRSRPSEVPAAALAAAQLFHLLVEELTRCHASGTRGPEAKVAAVLLWTGLHGLAALPPHHPRFPWPDPRQLLTELLDLLIGSSPRDPSSKNAA